MRGVWLGLFLMACPGPEVEDKPTCDPCPDPDSLIDTDPEDTVTVDTITPDTDLLPAHTDDTDILAHSGDSDTPHTGDTDLLSPHTGDTDTHTGDTDIHTGAPAPDTDATAHTGDTDAPAPDTDATAHTGDTDVPADTDATAHTGDTDVPADTDATAHTGDTDAPPHTDPPPHSDIHSGDHTDRNEHTAGTAATGHTGTHTAMTLGHTGHTGTATGLPHSDAIDNPTGHTGGSGLFTPSESADTGVDSCLTCDATALPFGGGQGTAGSPYFLCAPEHVDNLRTATDAHAEVCNDIDLAPLGTFTQIPSFTGVIEGNRFVLSNLDIQMSGSRIAMFNSYSGRMRNLVFDSPRAIGPHAVSSIAWSVDAPGVVENISVRNAVVESTGDHAGGAFGSIGDGAIMRRVDFTGAVTCAGTFCGGVADSCLGLCETLSASGTLIADSKAGGVVQQVNGTLRDCRSDMTVQTDNKAAGITAVLTAGGTIEDCYVEGITTARHVVSGAVSEGWNGGGTVERVYVSGPVRVGPGGTVGALLAAGGGVSVVDCVWDVNATGQTTTLGGGRGLTTLRMQTFGPNWLSWAPTWTLLNGDYPRRPWE